MTSLGLAMLWVAFIATLGAIGALILGHLQGPKRGTAASKFGYYATFISFAALSIAVLVMIVAFFRQDYTFMYVAENHPSDVSGLAWLYKLSGLWAGREGSFMLWAWLLATFGSVVALKRLKVTDALSNMGIAVMNVVLALFSAAMLFSDSNAPFNVTPDYYLDPKTHQLIGEATGWGMSPLLQHWAMVLHPPMLFIGYAGMTVPFAFAIAALIVGDGSKKWVEIVDRITIFAWLFLGAGIGLGAVWAYVRLGWGGYWGWDPVENASLLPWLTGVGLLHSFTVYKRRDGFKRWAVSLSGSTFALVILGTFITRTGIVKSQHTFSPDAVSYWLFLTIIVLAVVVPLLLLAWRWKEFAGNDEFESLTSKEAAYYFNNVIMLVAGWLVAYMTISSAFPKWMPLGQVTLGPNTFDAVARPVGIVYLGILAFCPLLAWRATDAETLWKRIRIPLIAAAVMFLLLALEWGRALKPIYDFMVTQQTDPGQKFASAGPAWYYNALALLGFAIASVLIANTVWLFIDSARRRSASKGEGFGSSLWAILTKARTQTGGYLAHIGMGIILIGLVGSAMFVQDQTFMVPDQNGAQFNMADYTFTYTGATNATLSNGNTVENVNLLVSRGGKQVGTISPSITEFVNMASDQRDRLDAQVLSEPLRDIFVVFQGGQDNRLVINVKINPLIWFTWIGFGLLMVGTVIAVWPRRGGPAPEPQRTAGSKKRLRAA
jgi:cytochrome c-type biogenesis protein CcmF